MSTPIRILSGVALKIFKSCLFGYAICPEFIKTDPQDAVLMDALSNNYLHSHAHIRISQGHPQPWKMFLGIYPDFQSTSPLSYHKDEKTGIPLLYYMPLTFLALPPEVSLIHDAVKHEA